MKRILDTVHGSIFVDQRYIDNFIDTPLFQRLRRIEQSSIRSIFPSARHDRFAHSLGVFHIGLLIERHISSERKKIDKDKPNADKFFHLSPSSIKEAERLYKEITYSYRIACLLHDIAHAPFSHTFEKYYGTKKELAELLKGCKGFSDAFCKELDSHIEDVNYHEYASAYVAATTYENPIGEMKASVELVVRMIIGVQYSDHTKRYNQIANGYISLIHGDVIDADRLDYACRDVWASGYATSRIDVLRLASGIHFAWIGKQYQICYDANVLNEIESVINVKDFQMNNVIHHHTVEYEQDLLKHAAEHMAKSYYPQATSDTAALKNIITLPAVTGSIELPSSGIQITNITDDDLIFLIKKDVSYDDYIEWSSRQYKKFALWKTRNEFYIHFGDLLDRENHVPLSRLKPIVLQIITARGYKEEDLRIVEMEFGDKIRLDDVWVKIGNKHIKYNELFHKSKESNNSAKHNKIKFCYVYLTKGINDVKYRSKEFYELKDSIIDEIHDALSNQIEIFKAPLEDDNK